MNLFNKNINILIPDGESHLLLEVATCLSEVKGLKIYIMSNKHDNPMKYSRWIHHFSYVEKKGSTKDWLLQIDQEVSKWNIDIIMPIFEVGIKELIENQYLLKSKDKLMSWPKLGHYETAIDKWQLFKHLKRKGIPCPKTFLIEHELPKQEIFPLVVKPTKGFGGGMGVKLIENESKLKAFWNEVAGSGTPYIAQEYIKGDDYCCNVLCSEGKILCYTIQKGIMWGSNRFAAQIGHEFVYDESILQISSQLMESLSWSGVACLDIKFDERANTFRIIEINTRYWRSLLGSLSAGMNFPKCAIYHHFKMEMPQQYYHQKKYLNLKGLIQYLKDDFRRLFKFGFLWKNTALKYAILDPLPMVYKFFTRKW